MRLSLQKHLFSALAAAMCLVFTTLSHADAQDAPTDLAGEIGEHNDDTIRLRFLAIVPPHPNPLRNGRSSPYDDPTVIPFSGWQFFSPQGESQPWLKRSSLCYRMTGQYTDYRHPNLYRMMDFWTVSDEMQDVTARPHDKQSIRFVQRVPSFDFKSGNHNGYCYSRHYWAIKDPNQIPKAMTYRMEVSGKPERLAKLKPGGVMNAKFPLGEITYFGEVRTDTPHYAKLKNAKNKKNFKPGFEVTGNQDWDKEQWSYSFEIQKSKKLEGRRITYFTDDVSEFYMFTDMQPDEVGSLEITRQKNIIEYTQPISLEAIKANWKKKPEAKKIAITKGHTFGEPVTVGLVAQGGDGPCLIDLDEAKPYAVPQGVSGVALAKYFEEKQIDLRVLINTDKHAVVRAVGCSAYALPKEYWNATPYECVRHFDDIRNGTVSQVPSIASVHWHGKTFAEQLDRVFLATTSDGSMVMYRIDQIDSQRNVRSAKATITIRKVIEP